MNVPALVLVHGYPFDHTMWELVAAQLTDSCQVLVPDLRGFGDQPLGEDEPSLDRMADDLGRLLEEKSVPRAVVAGMSMGGYVALAFADRFKDRLAGLALISSQAAADSEEVRKARRTMIEKVRTDGIQPAVEAALPKMFSDQNRNRTELHRFPLRGAERAGPEGIAWALEAMARRPDRTALLRELKVPVLVLHGADDKFIPAGRARELAGQIPAASYVELPGVGHCSPIEAPAEVARSLKELLGRAGADGV